MINVKEPTEKIGSLHSMPNLQLFARVSEFGDRFLLTEFWSIYKAPTLKIPRRLNTLPNGFTGSA